MDDAAHNADAGSGASHLLFRLFVGLAQGLALAYLVRAETLKLWPATEPFVFIPVLIATVLWPPLLLVGATLRRPTFALWAIASLALIGALVSYDLWRTGLEKPDFASPALLAALPPLLFIAQSLITAADIDSRFIARYPTYFDTAWKLGIQAVFGVAFVTAFWVVLQIGAELFHLIKLDFLRELIRNKWFAIPATTVAFAYAVDLTDVRAGLISGVRNLALMLMSWVLPLMTLLIVAFLVALPITGVGPLWQTKSATALLLTAGAVLVILVNAAYRDGDNGHPLLIKAAGSIGAVALVPLVAIASYALMLRIGQYGLTPDRILAFFAAGMAVAFAMGYAISAVNIGGWLKGVEPTNVFTAFLAIAVLLALLTPLADPARLSVNDQVRRLAAGRTAAEEFDYDFLRFKSGRFGRDALAQLAAKGVGQKPEKVTQLAAEAQRREQPKPVEQPIPPSLASRITVYPAGSALPQGFLDEAWLKSEGAWRIRQCADNPCEAFLIDLDRDAKPEIVLGSDVFQEAAQGWTSIGSLSQFWCPSVQEALKRSEYTLAPSPYRDVLAGGARLHMQDNYAGCPQTPEAASAGAGEPK